MMQGLFQQLQQLQHPAVPAPMVSPPRVTPMEPPVPPIPFSVTPGQPTSRRTLGMMSDQELMSALDQLVNAQAQAAQTATAPSKAKRPVKGQAAPNHTMLALAALMEFIKPGSSQHLLGGYIGGRQATIDAQYSKDEAAYQDQVDAEASAQRGAGLEMQLRNQDIGAIENIFSGRAKSEKDRLDHAQRLEEIKAAASGRLDLEGLKQTGDWREKTLSMLTDKVSPQLRAEFAKMLGIGTEAAAAPTSRETLNAARTHEIEALLPARVTKAMAEGKGAELENTLKVARTRLETLRGDAQKIKNDWLPKQLAADVSKTEALAQKAHRDANDAVASVLGPKPPTGTALLNALTKVDDSDSKADAALAKLKTESGSLRFREQQLRSGADKSVSSGEVEFELKKIREAQEANDALQAYWSTIMTRNKDRREKINKLVGGAMGLPNITLEPTNMPGRPWMPKLSGPIGGG